MYRHLPCIGIYIYYYTINTRWLAYQEAQLRKNASFLMQELINFLIMIFGTRAHGDRIKEYRFRRRAYSELKFLRNADKIGSVRKIIEFAKFSAISKWDIRPACGISRFQFRSSNPSVTEIRDNVATMTWLRAARYYQRSRESDNSRRHGRAHSREPSAKSGPERILATIFALRVSTW